MIKRLYSPSWIRVGVLILLAPALFWVLGVAHVVNSASENLMAQPSYPSPPFSLSYSPDGMMIAGTADRLLRIWDATTGTILIDFPDMTTTYVLNVSWSPDNLRIVTASDDQFIRVWNVADLNYSPGQLLSDFQPFPENLDLVTSVDWSPDGQFFATSGISNNYSLKLWDAATYTQINQFGFGWIEKFIWHPDPSTNRLIIAGSNGGPIIVSTVTPLSGSISPLGGKNVASAAMAWNSDGSKIAIGYEDGSVYVWDSETDKQIAVMSETDNNQITSIAWSPDDTKIATANGNVQLWSSTTGELLYTFPGTSLAVDFSPDGEKLVYANGAGAIQIVDVPSFEMRASTK